ncbi:putative ABC transporter permease subunit [Undibacterium sp. TJN19]|uniref:putative ABC transporter permease subunit n=1 Tax=Undibacterium sp. TJN19 TaxID=3413055 RepID=UPI003BEF7D75
MSGSKRWFNFKPGSAAWLLMHECRLFFYDMGENKPGHAAARGMSVFGMGLILLAIAIIHFGVWMAMHKMPALDGEMPPFMLIGAGIAMLVAFSLMLSLGLTRSVRALFERGDLDLLLSSPLSSRTIFSVRLAGIVFGVSIWFFLLLAPVANVGLLMGQPRWLGIYAALSGLAVIASALAMLLTLGLVKTIGVRRTRTVGQILGALTGASIFILTQVFGNFGKDLRQDVLTQLTPWFQPGGMLDAQSLVWMPARALFGSLPAILIFLLLSLACFWFTAQFTHNFFVRGVQQAGGDQRKDPLQSSTATGASASLPVQAHNLGQRRFQHSLRMTIILKEWRLIARDPQLISQVLLQLLYMGPLFLLVYKGQTLLPGVAAGLVFLAASLAGSLIWVMVSAEDAPDLLRAAPVKPSMILISKLIAAILPVMVLLAPLLIWLLLQQTILGLAVLVCASAAMLGAALIHLWQAKPGTRAQFNKRGQSQILAGLLEALSSFAWAGCIYTGILYRNWLWIPVLVALLSLAMAWVFRIERNA